MSYTTMEKMVLDAVRGTPTTALLRTAHFRSRERAQTPGASSSRGWSSSDSDNDAPPETGTEGARDTDGSSFYAESDRATGMALISEALKRSTVTAQEPARASAVPCEQLTEGGETTE